MGKVAILIHVTLYIIFCLSSLTEEEMGVKVGRSDDRRGKGSRNQRKVHVVGKQMEVIGSDIIHPFNVSVPPKEGEEKIMILVSGSRRRY
jgi:hypothetical protein